MVITYTNRFLNTEKIYKMLGGTEDNASSHYVSSKLDEFTTSLDDCIEPRLTYRVVSANIVSGTLLLDESTPVSSRKLSRIMQGCSSAVCFVCTVGRAIEERIKHCSRNRKYSEAYILDAIGSVAAEETADQFYRDMQRMYAPHEQALTLRFSPGYCDWPLAEQKHIFDLLDTESIGVSLSSTCLMKPRKTISGVFGIMYHGSLRDDTEVYNPCTDCGKKRCAERRAQFINTASVNLKRRSDGLRKGMRDS